MSPWLTLSIIRYGSSVSGTIQRKQLRPSQHFGVVAIEKEPSNPPRPRLANLLAYVTDIYTYIHTRIHTDTDTHRHIYIYMHVCMMDPSIDPNV